MVSYIVVTEGEREREKLCPIPSKNLCSFAAFRLITKQFEHRQCSLSGSYFHVIAYSAITQFFHVIVTFFLRF